MVSEKTAQDLATGKMNLSFAGCGFLGIYHVGVASCFKEYAPHLIQDKIAGASAGALVACALISGCDLGECTSYTMRLASQARSRAMGPMHPTFNLVKNVREGLQGFLPENAHEIATGRLHVSLTRVSDRENVVVNQFDSKEELIQALICSSFVPFYCGMIPPKFRGVRYVDGGLSDNIPLLNDSTITVSPFAGESDICPNDNSANDLHVHLANTSIQFTVGNLYRFSHAFFPPHPEVLGQMCKQGFNDALRYLQRNSLINCTRHLSIQSSIVTDSGMDSGMVDDSMSSDESTEEEYDPDEEEWVSALRRHQADPNHQMETCIECKHRQHVALIDNLPVGVLSALQAACDTVNSGLFAQLYKWRAIQVLSLMTAPMVLPLDIMYVTAKRLYDWAPYMPSDMQWFVEELGALIKEIVYFVRHGRHQYSARFTCQLAITEFDYDQAKIYSLPGTPRLGHRSRSNTGSSMRRPTGFRSRSNTGSSMRRPEGQHRNLNVGFSVDFKSHYKEPIRCLDELRHHILDDKDNARVQIQQYHEGSDTSDTEVESDLDIDVEMSDDDMTDNEKVIPADQRRHRTHSMHSVGQLPSAVSSTEYDTFENCLHIANQMEAVLAFSYTDEDNPNVVKVTEIFAVDDPRGPKTSSELSWDAYVGPQTYENYGASLESSNVDSFNASVQPHGESVTDKL